MKSTFSGGDIYFPAIAGEIRETLMAGIQEADALFAKFVKSYQADRLAHAYLLIGDPRGSAGELAEKILCLLFCASEGVRPCFSCASCNRVSGRTAPDVLWCEPKNKSRTIAVDQIKKIQDYISRTSFEGGWKTAVFIGAERMNVDAANKFLKLLEEPPPKTMFLLLSAAPDEILPTVLSRCQKVKIPGVFRNAECERIVAGIMAKKSGAAYIDKMQKALAFCDVLGAWKAEITENIKAEIADRADSEGFDGLDTKEAAVVEARIEAEYKEKRADLLRSLELWFRDVFLCVAGGDDVAAFCFQEYSDIIRDASKGLTFGQALNNIKLVEEMDRQLNMYFSEQLVFERGFAGVTG